MESKKILFKIPDYLSVEDNGTVAVIKSFNRTNSGSRVILTISAVNKMKSLRASLVSTIVNIDVIYVNQGPQFIDSESPLTIGYPKRTYFDSTVPMPVFTPKVFYLITEYYQRLLRISCCFSLYHRHAGFRC